MTKTATLNARMDPRLKHKAERVFKKLDLSPTEALRLFYRQVVLRQGIPFDVCIPNEATRAAIAELDAGGGTVYTGSTEAVFDEVLRGDQHRAS